MEVSRERRTHTQSSSLVLLLSHQKELMELGVKGMYSEGHGPVSLRLHPNGNSEGKPLGVIFCHIVRDALQQG